MPLTSTNTPHPLNYLLVLYPAHQLLDSAGPLDILSTVTKQVNVPGTDITLTIVSETLSPVPLVPVAPRDADWSFEESPELSSATSPKGKIQGTGFNVPLTPTITFSTALESLRKTGGKLEIENAYGQLEQRTIDVLLIPGGIGSRMYRISKATGERSLNCAASIDFVGEICRQGWVQSAVLTVCTGSDLFARTGLLRGRRATTNFMAFDMVRDRHRDVRFLKGRRWVRSLPGEGVKEEGGSGSNGNGKLSDGRKEDVFEREVWTSAGISAGMDLTLWFVAEVYGRDFARGIARRLAYEWKEGVGEGEVDPFY